MGRLGFEVSVHGGRANRQQSLKNGGLHVEGARAGGGLTCGVDEVGAKGVELGYNRIVRVGGQRRAPVYRLSVVTNSYDRALPKVPPRIYQTDFKIHLSQAIDDFGTHSIAPSQLFR